MEWAEVVNNPLLKDLPFKIELNRWGKILMSPASNQHGYIQADLVYTLRNKLPDGKVITECSIKTSKGIKVADVAWLSNKFVTEYGFNTPYEVAPEICIEVISPSNSKKEMDEKIKLYLNQGALEVWLCDLQGKISFYSKIGRLKKSKQIGAKKTI
jgi:Uma2 family endonuclease